MKPIQVTGHVDKNGKLELGELPTFPPNEDLHVLIMESSNIAALEQMMELVAGIEGTDPCTFRAVGSAGRSVMGCAVCKFAGCLVETG